MKNGIIFAKKSTQRGNRLDLNYLDETSQRKINAREKNKTSCDVGKKLKGFVDYASKEELGQVHARGFLHHLIRINPDGTSTAPSHLSNEERKKRISEAWFGHLQKFSSSFKKPVIQSNLTPKALRILKGSSLTFSSISSPLFLSMRPSDVLLYFLCSAGTLASYFFLPAPLSWCAIGLCALFGTWIIFAQDDPAKAVLRLVGLSWSLKDFVRGWLITGNSYVPTSTSAKVIVDTATSLSGGRGGNPFFPTKAQMAIQTGFEILRHIGAYVTIPNVHHLLLNAEDSSATLEILANRGDQRSHELLIAFRDGYLGQPPEQLGGVQGTLSTYLDYFISPEIPEVFCANEPTFAVDQIDHGKIV